MNCACKSTWMQTIISEQEDAEVTETVLTAYLKWPGQFLQKFFHIIKIFSASFEMSYTPTG